MELVNYIGKVFLIGFECICIIMAVYMAYKQVKIFYQNEDFSEISFQKFMDGPNDKYPTYTICFADNFERQLYKKFDISTRKYIGSMAFPFGRRINVEDNKLVIMNKTSKNGKYVYGDYDIMEIDKMYYGQSESEMKLVEVKEKDLTGMNRMRSKRRASTIFKQDRFYDLGTNGLGEDMILLKGRKKTYTISPKHYQLLLMGLMRSFTYGFNSVQQNNIVLDMNTTIADIIEFDFNNVTVDFNEFLVDFHVKMENGSTYGWTTDRYRYFESYCPARSLELDRFWQTFTRPHLMPTGEKVSGKCYEEDSFLEHLEKRITSKYPMEKVYQDPTQICYSPKLDPRIYKISEQLTLDLKNMFYRHGLVDQQQFRIKSSFPFMKIYIHMQGQFMRKIGKEVSAYTAADAMVYCSSYPYPPRDLSEENECYGTRLTFDISQVTLLRSRHDARKSCNLDLKDEDSKIVNTLINDKTLRCRPLYWRGLENIPSSAYCTNILQYKYITELTSNFTTYEKIRNRFEPPCEEMIIVTNVQTRKGRKLHWKNLNGNEKKDFDEQGLYWDIQFTNVNDRYQVTENSRAFTGESCWAGIGGFIGIFIGVSLMQIPELLAEFVMLIKSKVSQYLKKI